jgi:phosphoribosyl 1,2-cyclic phosphodiesterase
MHLLLKLTAHGAWLKADIMISFASLSSCSDGNSYVIFTDSNKLVIIDAGISYRKLKNSLASLGLDAQNVTHVIITHAHNDHIKGLPSIYKQLKPTLIVNSLLKERFSYFENLSTYTFNTHSNINGLDFFSIEVPHDHINSSFLISYESKRIGFISDAGILYPEHLNHFKNLDFLVIESNHSLKRLELSNYPELLKIRIKSDLGHLSNLQCGEIIAELYHYNLKCILFIHLSKRSNHPDTLYDEVISKLQSNFPLIDYKIAPYDSPSDIIEI